MGGKKKKGLSNRLARMSDEERARYLQHRAAVEEEAKRRKEQLIATYMKNKLKKEEAFTRLNIAKINEYWHQILRKIKVHDLKTEIEDMRTWITKIIDIKNSIIIRLIKEIEEGEEQYQLNIKSHLMHIDNFIDIHDERQNKLQINFDQQLGKTVNTANKEMEKLVEKSYREERYLKTVLYIMECNFNDFLKEVKTFRTTKLEDYSNSLNADHDTMVKTYSLTMTRTWQGISQTLREYLSRVDQRRHHYIELVWLDRRNAAERRTDDKRIEKYTKLIQELEQEYEMLKYKNEKQIKELEEVKQNVSQKYQQLKRKLSSEIKYDEKILKNMTVVSNAAIQNLEKIFEKGNKIRNFVTCCSRIQTEKQKIDYWDKYHGKVHKFDIENEETLDKTTSLDTTEENTSASIEEEIIIQQPEVKDIYPEELEVLSKMEGLWWTCNKAKIECIELKKECEVLIAENKNMKKIVKGVLCDAALETPPLLPMTFPVYTKIKSAPVKSENLYLQGLDFLVIDL